MTILNKIRERLTKTTDFEYKKDYPWYCNDIAHLLSLLDSVKITLEEISKCPIHEGCHCIELVEFAQQALTRIKEGR